MSRRFALRLLLPMVGLLLLAQGAYAACSSPTGTGGDMTYSTSANVMAYCDGTNWISMNGGVSLTVNTSGGGVTPYGSAGDVQINGGGSLSGDTGNFKYSASTLSTPIISASTGNITTMNSNAVNNTGLGTFGSILDNGGLTVLGAASMTTVSASAISGTIIQVGDGGGAACSSNINGALKFDATSNTIAICTGTSWTSLASGTITGSGVLGGSATAIAFWNGPNSLTYESATTSGLYWDHAIGRLGVGTNSPSDIVTISATTPANGYMRMLTTSTTAGGLIVDTGAANNFKGLYLQYIGADSSIGGGRNDLVELGSNNADIVIRANAERARFTQGGNVGIATQSPTATLQVSGTFTVSQTGQNTASAASLLVDSRGVSVSTIIHLGSNAIVPIGAGGNAILSGTTAVSTSAAGSITFYAGGAQRMYIDSGGISSSVVMNVTEIPDGSGGFYTSSVGSHGLVQIRPDGANGNAIRWGGNGAGSNIFRFLGGGDAERMRIDGSGNVGIGTSSPGDSLQVNGKVAATGYRSRSGYSGSYSTNYFDIYWTGSVAQLWIDATNVGNITVSSDRRVKKDIATLQEESGLAAIEKMRPVSFHWKDTESGTNLQYGFIAQEMVKVLPEIVSNTGLKTRETPDGLLRIDYNGLFAPIVKAVQDLKHLFDTDHDELVKLRAANDNLEARVRGLEEEMRAMKKAVQ